MKGKFLIDREIFESDLWEKPAYYLKIWIWLVGKANWKEIKKGGKVYHRGEFSTDYDKIIESNRWKVGYRYEYLTKNDIFYVLDFLRRTRQIRTEKSVRGLWIKIIEYDESQTLLRKVYEKSAKQIENEHETSNEANSFQTAVKQGKRNTNEKKNNILSSKKTNKHSLVKSLFDYYEEQFLEKISNTPPIYNYGICSKLAERWIEKFGLEEMKKMLDLYLYLEDKIFKQEKWSLSCFFSARTIHLLSQPKPK